MGWEQTVSGAFVLDLESSDDCASVLVSEQLSEALDIDLHRVRGTKNQCSMQRARNLEQLRRLHRDGDWAMLSAVCTSINAQEELMRESVRLSRCETVNIGPIR